jgi:guanosine-3',5'-bis(diphosphate) 3'-pyrophosphohydrolase
VVHPRRGGGAAPPPPPPATDTNIGHLSVVERDTEASTLSFELQVRDRAQLARVIRAIRSMPEVLSVERTLA